MLSVACVSYITVTVNLPKGLIVAARSRIVYGAPCLSRRAPSIRPPRPAPTISTVGFLRVSDIVAVNSEVVFVEF